MIIHKQKIVYSGVMVVGIDEVGRGSWAGPLVVGAVLLGGKEVEGLTDSKKLSPKKRLVLASKIKQVAEAIGLGWVAAETIDKIGLAEALKMAARLAMRDIDAPYEQIIIDGNVRLLEGENVVAMKKADLLVPSVSAASIVAKVARDYYMGTIAHEEHPEYGFDKHVGYGTAIHSEALVQNGPCELHRLSFAPVRSILGVEKSEPKTSKIEKTMGREAEKLACEYLQNKGYEVIAQNWRTKLCEIDIVAKKADITYLIEVKYRKNPKTGDGMSAITPKKLKQMQFAARVWQHWKSDKGDIRLGVISMSKTPPEVKEFILI